MNALLFSTLLTTASAEPTLRTEVGVINWQGEYSSPVTAPVNSVALTIGRPLTKSTLEFKLGVDTWNGMSYDLQPAEGISNLFQGDSFAQTVSFGIRRALKTSGNRVLSMRVHIGATIIPILMDEDSYNYLVVQQSWGLSASPNHQKLYPGAQIGVAYDVYRFTETLALGLNADAQYLVGWDLGSRLSLSLTSHF